MSETDQLKLLRAKASPGVWEAVPSFEGAATADIMRENANLSTGDDYVFVDSEGLRGCALVEDAEYVAALHNALPGLIADAEENEGVIKALRRHRDTAESKLNAVRRFAELHAELWRDHPNRKFGTDVLAILDGCSSDIAAEVGVLPEQESKQ